MYVKTILSDAMKKYLFLLLFFVFFNGCMEREIYTEITQPSFISHPPAALRIDDISGSLKSDFKHDSNALLHLEVYTHCANCTNVQSRSIGTDFDGYIRITIKDVNSTIARAQMDYKGEADAKKIQHVYDHLMKELKWKSELSEPL